MMAKFIQLTTRQDGEIFINMDCISRFYLQETSTFLILDEQNNFSVKETPEQILSKMKELQGESKSWKE